ncbi:MAG: hypothetical protein JWO69_1671 [Thermoleophilia bacterium]|nr:hypothetical protein [Thermoleophilia bacterium]
MINAMRPVTRASASVLDSADVIRRIVPKSVLEMDPRLAGHLEVSTGGKVPKGVTVRTLDDGTSVVTANVRMLASADKPLNDAANESIEIAREIGAFIVAMNPDVVFMQELRSRPMAAAFRNGGLPEAPSIMAHLMGATDMAFTPAVHQDPFSSLHEFYGTAVYTRNGYSIGKAINGALPTSTSDVERRSVALVEVKQPGLHGDTFSMLETHTASEERTGRLVNAGITTGVAKAKKTDQALRDAQVGAMGVMADDLYNGRPFTVQTALNDNPVPVEGYPSGAVVFGGDINQKQVFTDDVLRHADLRHVNDSLAELSSTTPEKLKQIRRGTAVDLWGADHRIDHIYERGMQVESVDVVDVPRNELLKVDTTDHRFVRATLRRAADAPA